MLDYSTLSMDELRQQLIKTRNYLNMQRSIGSRQESINQAEYIAIALEEEYNKRLSAPNSLYKRKRKGKKVDAKDSETTPSSVVFNFGDIEGENGK